MKWLADLLNSIKLTQLLKKLEFERVKEELKILHDELKNAVKFFKSKPKLPLYMVIGYSTFGKTTLLSKTGLKLSDVSGNYISTVPTKYFSWWFSDNAVYLDTAGSYSKTDKEDPHYNLVWAGFLKLLKKYFNKHTSGLIVVVDFPTLSGKKEFLQKVLNDIRERVYDVAKYTDELPVYVVFTKFDLVQGFEDFFGTLTHEERKEYFGIAFNKSQDIRENLIKKFNTKFDELLEYLQERSIKRLSEESSTKAHFNIVNFPAQFASLRSSVLEVLNILPYGNHINLSGLYFTSSLQYGTPIDFLETEHVANFNLREATIEENNFAPRIVGKEPYFIENLFKRITFNKTKAKERNSAPEMAWDKTVYILGISLAVLIIIFVFGYARNDALAVIEKSGYKLNSYATSHSVSDITDLEQEISNYDNAWWSYLGFNQVNKLKKTVDDIYYNAIYPNFVSDLQRTIESVIIVSETSNDTEELYSALKTYTMLSGQKPMDVVYIKNWFEQYWGKNLLNYPAKRLQLQHDLALALDRDLKIPGKMQIIAEAKIALNNSNIPKVDTLYSELEKRYQGQNLEFTIAQTKVTIPKIYTIENFNKIYNIEISEIVNLEESKNNNAVFDGEEKKKQANDAKAVKDFKNAYLKKYAEAWDEGLKSVKIDNINFNDVKSAASYLNDAVSSSAGLLQFLRAIQINTVLDMAPTEFSQMVTSKFVGINALDLKLLYASISSLANYLSGIANDENPDKAAFTATIERFQNANLENDTISVMKQFALKEPYPVQPWLQSLAQNSWKAMLKSTQKYINSIWASSVLPQFNSAIANKYPVFKDAKDSVVIEDFIKFFASEGIMDSFFNYYLKPFVDTTQVYWVWKEVDKEHLDIPQETLELFIRAALIQKMFAIQGNDLTMQFALTPIAMSPTTQSFMLNVTGQFVAYHGGQKKTDRIDWSAQNDRMVTMEFVSTQGKHNAVTINNDPWALFRVLDKANIHQLKDSQHFELLFDLNGNSVKYQLTAAQPVNPFIPEILSNFKCPSNL